MWLLRRFFTTKTRSGTIATLSGRQKGTHYDTLAQRMDSLECIRDIVGAGTLLYDYWSKAQPAGHNDSVAWTWVWVDSYDASTREKIGKFLPIHVLMSVYIFGQVQRRHLADDAQRPAHLHFPGEICERDVPNAYQDGVPASKIPGRAEVDPAPG